MVTTVKELITQLQALPESAQELPVRVFTYDDYRDDPVALLDFGKAEVVTDRDTGSECVMITY